jgi:hypothetical protein
MISPNIFYYTNSKKIFSSKIDAIKHNKKTGERLFYYYYDHVYSKLNWSIEPPESLNFYYKEQAQRIRDLYDYVILMYSGGYDSTNILETFHFNNIKLDKIVCVGAFSQDSVSGVDENHNGELYHNCFPYVTELGLTSITQICDYTKHFDDFKNFSIYEYGKDWVGNVGAWFSPHMWFWRDLERYVVPTNLDNKKVAIIWGRDKPVLCNENGRIGFKFTDAGSYSYGETGFQRYPNIDRINFYWDPNYPLIIQKQYHTLKKLPFLPNNMDGIIYNLKKPLIYKSPKSGTPIFSLRDKYLLNHKNSEVFDFYKMGVREMLKDMEVSDIKRVKSRQYYASQE